MTANENARPEDEDEYEYIFRKTIRLRNGRVLHASQYGLEAFRIRVKRRPSAA